MVAAPAEPRSLNGEHAYPATYYSATLRHQGYWPPLAGRQEAEICVVGGGLAGVATALALAERGRAVALLEARRIGWGASGRNGGLVGPGYAVSMMSLHKRLGRETALALWRLSLHAVDEVRRHAGQLGTETLVGNGGLVCRAVEHPDTLRAYVRSMNELFDAGLVFVPQAELREVLATESYADGYRDSYSFSIHPLNLVHGMVKEAARHGARVHEGSPARRIDSSGRDKLVVTDFGSIRARHVVLCGGAYLGFLNWRVRSFIVPVASFVMVTRPDQERIRQAIRTDAGVSDTGLIPDYYRLLPDGRLLWGGRAAAREWPIPKIKQRLLRGMTRLYPQLADIPVDMAWSGLMPFARHQMPVITCISDGLWIASGFGGHGLAATTLAGTLIAAAIAEGDDRYRLFAPFGMPFAGGPLLGRAAVQLVVWHQRVKEHVGRAVFQSGARHGASNQTQE